VADVVRLLAAEGVAFVPRGAGTGLPAARCRSARPVMICTSRLQAIEAIDRANRRIVVQAGVVNQWVTNAVKADGLHYAPDPSSQPACTIGGNVAENSGGPHTLKYGVTTNHVLGVELVLPVGRGSCGSAARSRTGRATTSRAVAVGSEGTFGIVTRATLKLVRTPESYRTLLAVFGSIEAASETVSGIRRGRHRAGGARDDGPAHRRCRRGGVSDRASRPRPAAVLLVELDGPAAGLDEQLARVAAVCRAHGSIELRGRARRRERAALWKARKRAFGAVGRLAPNYCTQDGVVPRRAWPDILRAIQQAAGEASHPRRQRLPRRRRQHPPDPALRRARPRRGRTRVLAAGREILEACIALGGSVTGEHGIGVEKIAQMPLLSSRRTTCWR
jgi:glycolate oxidase